MYRTYHLHRMTPKPCATHIKTTTPQKITEIPKQLCVTNILEGSVQKAADQVRVNVQLINAMTDAHVWADIYDRKLTDVFGGDREIAKTLRDFAGAAIWG